MSNLSKILVVMADQDDEKLVIKTLKDNNLANNVSVARNGQQALDYLFSERISRNTNNYPFVILLDLVLPKINGLDILSQIRSNKYTRYIPVIVFTSSTLDSDIVAIYSHGANSYLHKPIEVNNLMQTVEHVGGFSLQSNNISKTRLN